MSSLFRGRKAMTVRTFPPRETVNESDQKTTSSTCALGAEPPVHAPYGFVINEFGDSVPARSPEEAAQGVRRACGQDDAAPAPAPSVAMAERDSDQVVRMREQFEAMAHELGFTARCLAMGPDSRYVLENAQDAWTFWQKSASIAARAAEERIERQLEVLRGQNELLRMELDDTRVTLAREVSAGAAKAARRDWVDCPVCDEPDMCREVDEENNPLIRCTNHNCGSNGGTNWSAFPLIPDMSATGVATTSTPLSAAAVASEKQLLTQAWKAYHGDQPANFSEAFLFAAGWIAGRAAKPAA